MIKFLIKSFSNKGGKDESSWGCLAGRVDMRGSTKVEAL